MKKVSTKCMTSGKGNDMNNFFMGNKIGNIEHKVSGTGTTSEHRAVDLGEVLKCETRSTELAILRIFPLYLLLER
jgi:hypothetical protein